MLTKRIIPCLDIKNWRVVKWTNFENLKDAWDPIELWKYYSDVWADELVFLDITATKERRETLIDTVRQISKNLQIPFTAWWWIKTIEEIKLILKSWADKVSLNSSVITNPELIKKASDKFWSQAIVIAIDYKKIDNKYFVFSSWWSIKTDLDLFKWCKQVCKLWAWELLITWMDFDWTKNGFDLKVLDKISKMVNIPIIASGWAWKKEDFLNVFKLNVQWALAASVFHYSEINIKDLKQYLNKNKIPIRI